MRNRRILMLGIIALLIFVLFAGAFFWQRAQNDASNDVTNQSGDANHSEVDEVLRIVATGDMIAHDSVIANAEQADGSYDFLSLMADMKPYFKKADVRFCNQATPAGGEDFGISGYPVFNAPLAFNDGIADVGCNVINLGTNHTNDKGQPLIDAMVEDWSQRPDILATAGANRSQAERDDIDYFDVKGINIAFLSYSTYSNDTNSTPYGVVMYDEAKANQEISEAKENADIVLVSMRWGDEYADTANETQKQQAQTIVNAGADYIFGHGPHVLQPVETIAADDGREGVVWYSLGNFLNTQIPPEALIGGFAIMDIDRETLSLSRIQFLPVYSHYEWSVEEAGRQDLMARRNLQMLALDKADNAHFERNQLDTTVQAQTERVHNVLNRLSPVEIITSDEY